jgi:hypothetical protein
VTSSPSIPTLTVKPFPYHIGDGNVTITASISGGAHPLTFVYSGLPPGCATINASNISCAPTAIGDFTITLNVSDAAGEFNSSQATLVVDSATAQSGWTSRDTVFAIAAGVGVVVILGIVYWRRSTRRTEDTDRPAPPDSRKTT